MKIIKNKTYYTIEKGMGKIIIGEIINYVGLGTFLKLSENKSFWGLRLKIEDIEFILKEMKKIEKELK